MTYQAMAAGTMLPTIPATARTMASIFRTSIGLFTRKEILRRMQRKSSLPNH